MKNCRKCAQEQPKQNKVISSVEQCGADNEDFSAKTGKEDLITIAAGKETLYEDCNSWKWENKV